jgi:shikimate kinase
VLDHGGHLVLIGPMGSGKTTVGEVLARRLGRPFFDSDRQIEAEYGASGRDLASVQGVAWLHRVEDDALRKAISSEEPAVIAAAASVANRPGLSGILGDAFVVLLTGDAATLAARAERGGHRRPVSIDEYAEVSAIRAEAVRPIASLEIDVTELGPEAVVDEILAGFRSREQGKPRY